MEDKTYTYVFYDILDKVLQLSENPSQFADYLTQQIREIIGAKTVAIAIVNEKAQTEIFSVFPIRRKSWCEQELVLRLADISFRFNNIEFLSKDGPDAVVGLILEQLEVDKTIALPLIAANRTVGSILLLDIMDQFGMDAVLDLLNRLSGVFALIIRNSILYHNLETLVAERTNELQRRNDELQERERQLKEANEEYEKLNEELNDNIKKIEASNMQLEKAKEKAEESDQLKTAFLQNISHEIRTPMNAIVGFSELLRNSSLSADKRNDYIDIIGSNSCQLLSIVSDLLTISSIETHQVEVFVSGVCLNSIIDELMVTFEIQANAKNICLKSAKPLMAGRSIVQTDRAKIVRVFTKLIANSLKFTFEGFIEFGYSIEKEEVVFYVKDSGIGIEKMQQEKIFNSFRQVELGMSRRYSGTGLGLSISKGFVELLGGRIWVDSEPNKGSDFYFTIPYLPLNNGCLRRAGSQ